MAPLAGGLGCEHVFINGRVHTFDARDRMVEAVAVGGGRILAVGTIGEIAALAPKGAAVTDLGGRTVLPGLIDAHIHLANVSMYSARDHQVDLHVSRVSSLAEALAVMRAEVAKFPQGNWVRFRGDFWWEQKIADKRFPTLAELDAACPDHPIALFSGAHLGMMNSRALHECGITADTPQPGYGSYQKDPATGAPLGGVGEIGSNMPRPAPDRAVAREQIRCQANEFLALGLTSIHELPFRNVEIGLYHELHQAGEIALRVRVYPIAQTLATLQKFVDVGLPSGLGNDNLAFGGIKLFLDGEYESGCSAMHDPYVLTAWPSHPGNRGQTLLDQEALNAIYALANQANLQVLIHATGDRAVDMVLDAVEHAQRVHFRRDHRHRIEHCGVYPLTKAQMLRIKALGCIPSPQPQFLHSMGDYFGVLYGEDVARRIMPYRTMLAHGLCLPLSSDSTGTQPESTNPFWTIWCAVARRTFRGTVIGADEKLTVREAVRAMTVDAARAGFEEASKGSIEPGKLADMVVLDEDIFAIDQDRIKDIQVQSTIVGGQEVYRRER